MRIVRFLVEGKVTEGTYADGTVYSSARAWPLQEVRLLVPTRPSKVVCLGRNYAEHAREMGHHVPQRPLLFLKPPSSTIAPEEAIRLPPSPRVDYEGELAVVISHRCRDVPPGKAEDVILGYTCLNDVTDRDAQRWERNWVRAKGFDTACPVGPWVVTPDELEFPLTLETRVNGVLRQRADTSMLLTSIPEIIAEITAFMTLERGDLIATGTPSGVGPLAPGDTVEVTIQDIGTLANPVERSTGRD